MAAKVPAVVLTVEATEVLHIMQQLIFVTSPPMLAGFAATTIGSYLGETAEQRFTEQGSSEGPWEPLRPMTQRIRESMGLDPDFPINVRFGDLRQWLSDDHGIVEPTAFGVDLWWPGLSPDTTLEDELETAQMGRTDPPTVRRPVVELTEEDAIVIFELFAHWIQGAFRGQTNIMGELTQLR